VNERELEEVKGLFLNKTWLNAFSVATKVGREKLAQQLGEQILQTLKATLDECQAKKEYPYKTVILFTVS